MVPTPTNRKYHELTEKQKRAVLGACLSHRVDGVLPRGSYAKIARNLLVSRRAVGRLWKSAHSTRANSVVATPEVKSNKGHHEPNVIYNREDVMQQIKEIPLWKRTTVRNAAKELAIPKSTVQRIIKEDGDGLCSKPNRLKVLLTDEHHVARIQYCFDQMRWHGATRVSL